MSNKSLGALAVTTAFVAAISLIGCAQLQVVQMDTPTVVPKTQPEIGMASIATVGSPVLTQARIKSIRYFTLDQPFEVDLFASKFAMVQGERLSRFMVDGVISYCSQRATYKQAMAAMPSCIQDSNNDGKLDLSVYFGGPMETKRGAISPPVTVTEQYADVPSTDSVRSELVYQGANPSTIKFMYREYVNDLARPAFTQEVEYPVQPTPFTVKFKEAQIDVTEIRPSEVRYVAKSGF